MRSFFLHGHFFTDCFSPDSGWIAKDQRIPLIFVKRIFKNQRERHKKKTQISS